MIACEFESWGSALAGVANASPNRPTAIIAAHTATNFFTSPPFVSRYTERLAHDSAGVLTWTGWRSRRSLYSAERAMALRHTEPENGLD
jgi:hypothetical protein